MKFLAGAMLRITGTNIVFSPNLEGKDLFLAWKKTRTEYVRNLGQTLLISSEQDIVRIFDGWEEQIEELEKGFRDLKSQLDENETLRLKTILSQSDSYVVEINGYKQREESAKHREDSLKRTIAELQETIDQLKGEGRRMKRLLALPGNTMPH